MTREQCIEAMARAIDPDAWDGEVDDFKRYLQACGIEEATAAYDAMLPHIQAERERVREMCEGAVGRRAATHAQEAKSAGRKTTAFERRTYAVSVLLEAKNDIRALDIGGQDG
jgi:hypothetical protein